MPTPVTFSIIVPVFERREMIGRAIESCLKQDHADFEVLVVDDASKDGTAERVASYKDPRVKLLRHAVNRGVCAARNTAIAAATGQWCVMLDSDFELLDGALSRLAEHCRAAPADVGNVASMCSWDHGPNTPIPSPPHDVVYDYEGYVRYWGGLVVSESFNCIRREVFERVRYPEGRAYEGAFHLDMARLYRFSLTREVFVLIHTDATNRITASPPAALVRRLLRDAHDSAQNAEQVLRAHGEVLGRESPILKRRFVQEGAVNHLLASERLAAIKLLLAQGEEVWDSPRFWVLFGVGMVGATPLALTRAWWTSALHFKRRFSPVQDGA